MLKKLSMFIGVALICAAANSALAMTPTVSIASNPNDSSYVQVNVVGDPNSSVLLEYYSTSATGPQLQSIGTTNASGSFSTDLLLSQYNIAENSVISVEVDGQMSTTVLWPYSSDSTTGGAISLNQTSAVMDIGQSSTLTVANLGSGQYLYLASNTGPQVADININGNQITVMGISAGQTTANVCVVNSSSNCASIYVVVQNSSSETLSFSENNVSILTGQNVQVNVSGGNGFYEVQNNSNSSVIGTSLNGPTLTLYANGTSGTSTITVCSTDMSACGVVNASIGTYSSTGLSFNNSNPYVVTGQTQTVDITGGYGNYYVSSNSDSSIVQAYVSTSTVTLYGNTPGTATVMVCSSSGTCGTLAVTVSGASGGTLALSQTSTSILVGQVTSVSVSGGTMPYSLLQSNSGIAQYTLNSNVVSVTGIAPGSSSVSVCSAAGGCTTLAVTVTSSTNSSSDGVEPTFSQNNVSLNADQSSAIYLSGNGGYYVSNNTNPTVVSASISGSSVILYGLANGSANISICQTGGQCNTLYATVSNTTVTTTTGTPITFSQSTVTLTSGTSQNVSIYGGSGSGYYVSYDSEPNIIGDYISGSILNVSGETAGNGVLSICSSANVCASLAVTVESSTATSATTNTTTTTTVSNSLPGTVASSKFTFTESLSVGSTGEEVTELQEELTSLGDYNGPVTGYYGSLTEAGVEQFQAANNIEQVGVVGPLTIAALNNQ